MFWTHTPNGDCPFVAWQWHACQIKRVSSEFLASTRVKGVVYFLTFLKPNEKSIRKRLHTMVIFCNIKYDVSTTWLASLRPTVQK